jgi:hypothetical protein
MALVVVVFWVRFCEVIHMLWNWRWAIRECNNTPSKFSVGLWLQNLNCHYGGCYARHKQFVPSLILHFALHSLWIIFLYWNGSQGLEIAFTANWGFGTSCVLSLYYWCEVQFGFGLRNLLAFEILHHWTITILRA